MALIEREVLLSQLRSHYNCVAGGGTIYTPSMMLAITDAERAPAIDPIRSAGGCRCGECMRYKDGICTTYKNSWGAPLEMGEHDFCSNCEPREAKDDG